MKWKEDAFYFQRTAELAREAMAQGDDGFASILVDEHGEILMEQGNLAHTRKDPTAHDTIVLAQRAVQEYPREVLEKCTVYALMEPCVMCMGALFWAGISKVKYAMSEAELNQLLPGGLEIHSEEFAARCPRLMTSEWGGEYPEAKKIVRDWVCSLGIPGIPPEGV